VLTAVVSCDMRILRQLAAQFGRLFQRNTPQHPASTSDSSVPLPQISRFLTALCRGKFGVADSHSACSTPARQYSNARMEMTSATLSALDELNLFVIEKAASANP
jgi:hypothetical protein